MVSCEQTELYFTGVVYPLEINATYTTSFQCQDGSYALISGADLTLKYDYGHSVKHVRITLYTILKFIESSTVSDNNYHAQLYCNKGRFNKNTKRRQTILLNQLVLLI